MSQSKLLFYTPGLGDGGAERLWALLASTFKAKGYDVIFAVDFEAGDNRDLLDPDIPVVVLGRNHAKSVASLAGLLRRAQPDVALSAVAGSNLKLVLAKSMARTGTPIVASYHGYDEGQTGWLSYLTYRSLPLLSKRVARIVSVSRDLALTLVSKWGADPAKMETLPNPVFVPDGAPLPSHDELAERPPVVLAVGRLSPEKDFVTLIRAFAQVACSDARLVILGKGPDLPRLKAEIDRLGLTDKVSLPGYTTSPWDAYRTAKCFALTSRSESFGNVIVEALAYGLPVVSTACAGPVDILENGTYGRLVAIQDDAQLARAISDMLENPGDPRPRRKRADDFSFANRFPAYEALIANIRAEAMAASQRNAMALRGRS